MAWQLKTEQKLISNGRLSWEPVSEDVTETGNAMARVTILSQVLRAKVPGGWFVRIDSGAHRTSFFYPDPNHEWDGGSLP